MMIINFEVNRIIGNMKKKKIINIVIFQMETPYWNVLKPYVQ